VSGGILDPKQPGFGTQVRELFTWMRAHPAGGVFITAVIVIALATALRPPPATTPDRLAEGDCLSLRGVTAPTDVVTAVLAGKADRAACATPHSHEVTSVVLLPAPTGLVDPPTQDGFDPYVAEVCAAAFEPYIGHAPAGSTFVSVPIAPAVRQWVAGEAIVVCLVGRADGAPMTSPARGSGD